MLRSVAPGDSCQTKSCRYPTLDVLVTVKVTVVVVYSRSFPSDSNDLVCVLMMIYYAHTVTPTVRTVTTVFTRPNKRYHDLTVVIMCCTALIELDPCMYTNVTESVE